MENSMRKFLFILFIMVAVAAQALVVRTEAAGQLEALVADAGDVVELSVTGPVDVSDLVFMAEEMPSLRTLDLTGADIVSYTGPRVGGLTAWPASYMPAGVFAGSAIAEVKLPAAAVKLGDAVFASSAIESFVLPAGYMVIPAGMFSDCKSLRTVEFVAPVCIDDHAFAGCTALAEVKGSQNITSIGDRSFAGCTALAEFAVGTRLSATGDEAFRGAGLKSIDLTPAAGLASVGEWAFASMPALVTANLGSCAEIGSGVLFGCTALESAIYNTAAVPDYAFAGNAVQDGVLAAGTESLGRYAMSGMSGVKDIALPESLESLGDHAMEHMTGLKNIKVTVNRVPSLGEDVWHGVNQPAVNLNVLAYMVEDYKNAGQWQNFNIISESRSNETVADVAGSAVRARFDGDMLLLRSQGADMALVNVYDPAGNNIVLLRPDADIVSIDCSSHATHLYIIMVRLADGTEAAIKLAR